MRAADLITASMLAAGGLIVLWDALRLGIGWGTDGPQSGFFPFWLAVLLIAACAAIFARSWQRVDRRPFVSREALRPVLSVLAPALGFVLVLQWLGFYVAAAVYLGCYMRWFGRYAWLPVVAAALVFPLLTFWVFETWFLVPLPKGPVEAWLGY